MHKCTNKSVSLTVLMYRSTHVLTRASHLNISGGQEYTRTIKRQLLQHQRWTRVHTHLQKAVAQANSVSNVDGTTMRQMKPKDFEYHVLLVQDITSGRHEYADLDASGRAVEKTRQTQDFKQTHHSLLSGLVS